MLLPAVGMKTYSWHAGILAAEAALHSLGLLIGSASMSSEPSADHQWCAIHQGLMWLPFTSSTASRSAMAT
jgi:hypothetical protein